jgi:AAA15 family ATPase/GTPase
MPDKHFTEWVEIENFKCFDSLKAENLKRVNLLCGDNNVGKSAFLEALEIISKTDNPSSLLIALRDSINRRQAYNTRFSEFDIITYEQDSLQCRTNNIAIVLKIKPNSQLSIDTLDKDNEIDENLVIELIVNNSSDMISYSSFSNMIIKKDIPPRGFRNARLKENTDFIPSTSLDERKLSAIYGSIVDMGLMENINIFLREFDNRIEFLVIRPTEQHSVFKVKFRDKNTPVLLSSMGGGLNRYIAIVCAIWKCKDGQLFIDEIENGIHYTKYEKLWEIIFKTSKAANCQIFATTHSKECIEAFSRVAEKYDHENIKYLNFSRTVDNSDKIVVTVLDSVGLENNFQLGLDVR